MSDWPAAQQWLSLCDKVRTDCSYEDSAQQLRELIRTGLVRFTDLRDRPEIFFLAHRMMVGLRGPGFWIRFTVNYNLFAGTVLGLGSEAQVAALDQMQSEGTLGCFALTEKLAGVNSGLVVLTTATWDDNSKGFLLHSPGEGEDAHKNWISQGLVADKAVVIADLVVGGKRHGPHGFLIDLHDARKSKNGRFVAGDMGQKTTGNDLDNAWLSFDNLWVPKRALLSRYCDIDQGQYKQLGAQRVTFAVFGQRLLSGRVCVAQAAATFCYNLVERTTLFAQQRLCWSPAGKVPLAEVPHIRHLLEQAQVSLFHMQTYMLKVEAELCKCLRHAISPSAELVNAIAVGKISVVEEAISLCFKLKQEVGSYALMAGEGGFEHLDFLQCCKFAEGDGRILQQKLARDQVKLFAQGEVDCERVGEHEWALCELLHKQGKQQWDANWQHVYSLAEAIQTRTQREWIGTAFTTSSAPAAAAQCPMMSKM